LRKLRQSPRAQVKPKDPEAEWRATPANPAELRDFRSAWTMFAVLATSVPYLVFWFQTPAGHHYSWILPPYAQDSFAYMAWSQQAAHGNVLFRLKYTAIPHAPFLFHPFFLICGWISRLCGCDIGVVHWAMKAVGVVLFFAAFYAYIDWIPLNRFQSIVASVLVGVSSGFGGLFAFLGLSAHRQIVPADLWMPEMSIYSSLLWNALFPYSLTLMLLIIFWVDRGTRDGRKTDFWLGGLVSGILALIHPYSVPLLFTYAVIVALVRRGPVALSLLSRFFAAASPFMLYVVLVSAVQPLMSRHSTSGEMQSRSFVGCLLGFGIPLLLCVAGLTVNAGQWVRRYWQLALWFLLSVGFAYLPFWFQRKFFFGAEIPLCILAAISLDLILARLPQLRGRPWALTIAALLFIPLLVSTPVYLLRSEASEVRYNADGTYYISDEMLAGLNFLKEKTPPQAVVFASLTTSRLIPAFAGNTVLWGHWAQSVDLQERKQWSARLLNDPPVGQDQQRANDFWGTGIEYVFADGNLKKFIEQRPEVWGAILKDTDQIFANSSVVIYRHRAGQQAH
jgi:hypothetical protein